MEPPLGRSGRSRIATEYEPVQPTYAQSTSRIKKPSLDDMGPGTDRPVPAREANVDSRVKAGAFGEKVKGPHKPTLDEMGPHAMLPVPSGKRKVSDPPGLTPRDTPEQGVRPRGSDTPPTRTVEVLTEKEKKGRRGRPRKTGRPGH